MSLGRLLATGGAALALSTSAGAAGPPVPSFLATWGSEGSGDGAFRIANGVAVDDRGDVYVADTDNNRVQEFSFGGRFVARLGRNGGDGSAGSGPGELTKPRGLGFDRAGNVYVAEKLNHRIQKFTADGRFLATWGGFGSGDGRFNLPYGVAVDGAGRVFVADTLNNRIQVFDGNGRFLGKWGRNGGDGSAGSAPGEFNGVYGIAIDCRGNVYATDEDNARVQKFGDGAGPAPLCAPKLTLRAPARASRGRSVVVRATCDRACIVRVGGTGVRTASAKLDVRGTARLALHVLRGAPEHLTLIARATGLAGKSRPLRRTIGFSR